MTVITNLGLGAHWPAALGTPIPLIAKERRRGIASRPLALAILYHQSRVEPK